MSLLSERKTIIVALGDGGYGNLGDEWLHEAVRMQHLKFNREYNIVCLMARPRKNLSGDNFFYIEDNVTALKRLNLDVENIEMVHFSGGGYLTSLWMKEKMWLYDYLVSQGLTPKKVVFTGAGLGPFTDDELSYVERLAKEVRFFGTRDMIYSEDLPQTDFTFDETIALLPDVANSPKRNGKVWVNCRIAEHVGVDDARAVEFVRTIEDFARSDGLGTEYFSMVNNNNLREHRVINKAIFKAGFIGKFSKKKRNSYQELLEMVSGASLIVATSYHAVLAALYTHTPVVAVLANEYYDKKFFGLKGVLETDLLTVKLVDELTYGDLHMAIANKDANIKGKLAKLKQINEEVYKKQIALR